MVDHARDGGDDEEDVTKESNTDCNTDSLETTPSRIRNVGTK